MLSKFVSRFQASQCDFHILIYSWHLYTDVSGQKMAFHLLPLRSAECRK